MIGFVLLLAALTIVAIIAHSVAVSGKNLFEPIYFFLIGYVGVFLLYPYEGLERLSIYYGEDFVAYCLLLAWICLIVFYIGYRSTIARKLYFKLPQPPATWRPGKLVPYGFFLMALGLTGLFTFIVQSGGLVEYYSTARGKGNYEGSSAYIWSAKTLLLIAFPILYIEIARKGLLGIGKIGVYLTTGLYFLYQIYIGQRSGIFSIGVSIMAWYYLPRIKINKLPTVKIFISFALAFALVGFAALFRQEFFLGSDLAATKEFFEKDLGEQIELIVAEGILGGGVSENSIHKNELAGYLQTLAAVPDRVDHDYGRMYHRYLYHWIPRIVWPEKPFVKDSMKDLVAAAPALVNGTITMLGTYYYNVGLVGMLLGSFVTGVCLGALEYWRKFREASFGVLLIYLVFFQYGRGVVMSGGILEGLDILMVFYVVPILGAFWYLRRYRAGRSFNRKVAREGAGKHRQN